MRLRGWPHVSLWLRASRAPPVPRRSRGIVEVDDEACATLGAGLREVVGGFVVEGDDVGLVPVVVIVAAVAASTAAATATLQLLQPLLYRYHLRAPFIGWLWRCFDSRASIRTSTSSSSLTLRSCSMARRRVFMSWFTTAARPVRRSPESTRSVRSSRSDLMEGSSRLALPLPPREAPLRLLSAFLASWAQRRPCCSLAGG